MKYKTYIVRSSALTRIRSHGSSTFPNALPDGDQLSEAQGMDAQLASHQETFSRSMPI